MDIIQRPLIDQNLRKLAETAGFSDIFGQDYIGYFEVIKDYIYLNGEPPHLQSLQNIENNHRLSLVPKIIETHSTHLSR